MRRYEQYGYEYLKERAEHIAAEKSDLMRCVGERNFSLVVRTVCALSQLMGEKSGSGFAESLSDGEILTLIQAQKFTSLSLDERGWQAVFALAGRLAEDSAAGTLIQQAQSCGDMARICSRMNDAMRLLKLIQGSLTASQAGLLRQHGGGFALSVFSAFTDEMWQLFTSCTSAAEGDYSATAKTLFGEDYAEYEKNIATCSAEQLKAAANGSDSDIFCKYLKDMWRAIAPSRHIYSSMIKLENIEKSYNGEPVLRGVSLEIADGEFISVMGESGSGKSTLLGVLGGFIPPDGGTVLWNGENIADFSEARTAQFRCRDMGFVFQSFRLISTLTARENIMLPAMVAGTCGRDMQDYMRQICERLGIESMLDKYPRKTFGRAETAHRHCARPVFQTAHHCSGRAHGRAGQCNATARNAASA